MPDRDDNAPKLARTPSASACLTTELVLPNDTNTLGNLMGGRLLHLMDVCAAISAQRHATRTVVTASVDSVDFRGAIRLGEVVVIEAVVNRAFTTSMEVGLTVYAESPATGGPRRLCNTAYYTFVAVDADARPMPVPRIAPETEAEWARYEAAARRRELRLVLSGRLAPGEAHSLGALLPSLTD
ncbi:MAG TPA: acyl-CoA thioesterase [Rubricoccaceae bacterium]